MLTCDACNGTTRVINGFFTVLCEKCNSGKLNVDMIWKARKLQEKAINDFRRISWENKMLRSCRTP